MSDQHVAPRLFQDKASWHREQAALAVKDKIRILLALQEQDLPLIRRQRPLKPWERPWRIQP